MCDKSEYPSEFRDSLSETCDRLSENPADVCEMSELFTGKLNVTKKIEKGGMYFFIIGNCYNYSTIPEYTASVKYELVNPGGEQLSSEEIPYPAMYIVLIVVWILITSIWMMNWIVNRTQHVKLHKVISLLPLFKTFFCAAALYYWKMLSSSGTETKALISIYGSFYIFFELSFYLILLIISSGWGITRDHFHARDKWVLSAIAIVLSASLILSFIFRGYFSVLMLVMYVIIIVIIFRYTNSNIIALRDSRSLEWTPPTNENVTSTSSTPSANGTVSQLPSDAPTRNSTDSHSSGDSNLSRRMNTAHSKLTMYSMLFWSDLFNLFI